MPSTNVSRLRKAASSGRRKWRGRILPIRPFLSPVLPTPDSLKKLQEKLRQQRKHLDELDSHIKELEQQQGGGEQH
jgi:hypothetical protein